MYLFWQSLDTEMQIIISWLVAVTAMGLFVVVRDVAVFVRYSVNRTRHSSLSKYLREQVWYKLTVSPHSNKPEFAWFLTCCIRVLGMERFRRVFYHARGRYCVSFWTSVLAGLKMKKIIGYTVKYTVTPKTYIKWRYIGVAVPSDYTDGEIQFYVDAMGYDYVLDLLKIEDKGNWVLYSACVVGGGELDIKSVTRDGDLKKIETAGLLAGEPFPTKE